MRCVSKEQRAGAGETTASAETACNTGSLATRRRHETQCRPNSSLGAKQVEAKSDREPRGREERCHGFFASAAPVLPHHT